MGITVSRKVASEAIERHLAIEKSLKEEKEKFDATFRLLLLGKLKLLCGLIKILFQYFYRNWRFGKIYYHETDTVKIILKKYIAKKKLVYRILYTGGFSDTELPNHRIYIYHNILEAIIILIRAMKEFSIPYQRQSSKV